MPPITPADEYARSNDGPVTAPETDMPSTTPYDAFGASVPGPDARSLGKRAQTGGVDVGRLVDAMRAGRRALRPLREFRLRAVKQYVGLHYSQAAAEKHVPVNMLGRFVQVIVRSLVSNNPAVMLTTADRSKAPAVNAMETWVNRRFVEMRFKDTLRRWVTDAVFGIGIMKTGIATPEEAAVSGYEAPAGEPFADTVDLDDFVYDSGAKDFRKCSFIGHRYRVPLDVAKSMSYFNAKTRKGLEASMPGDARVNTNDGDYRINTVGMGWESGEERDFEEMVDLWEVYLTRQRLVVTLASEAGGVPSSTLPPLRVQEWIGPGCGPYHVLGLGTVPGNAVPKCPVLDLLDLHNAINQGYRKLINQAQRQKEVLPVSGGKLDDSRNLIQASDGEAFGCDNSDAIKPVSYGGPSQINLAFAQHLQDLFSKQSGNLDLLAGTAPQSKTASQDKLLAQNSSATVADMQDQVTGGIADVASALCWFWWNHPTKVMESQRSAPGVPDVSITRRLNPAGGGGLERVGRYEDLNCQIDPYSIQYRAPQERLAFMNQVVQTLTPMLPLLQQQGVMFDAQAFLKKIAKLGNEPEITDLFTVADPIAPEGAGGDGGGISGKPPVTERNYTRQSVGQDTEANRTAELMNAAAAASGGNQ